MASGLINPVTGTVKSTGVTDHARLLNRDAADQHPISAITGLEAELKKLAGDASAAAEELNEETLARVEKLENASNTYLSKAEAADMYATQNDIECVDDKVNNLSAGVADLSEAVAKVNNTVAEVNQTLTGLNSASAANQAAITNLDTKLTSGYLTKSEVSNTYSKKSDVEATYLTKSEAEDSYAKAPALDELDSKVTELITTTETTLADVNESIDALDANKAAVEYVDSQDATLRTDLLNAQTALNTKLTDVKTRIEDLEANKPGYAVAKDIVSEYSTKAETAQVKKDLENTFAAAKDVNALQTNLYSQLGTLQSKLDKISDKTGELEDAGFVNTDEIAEAYLNKKDAASIYLSKADAESVYMPKSLSQEMANAVNERLTAIEYEANTHAKTADVQANLEEVNTKFEAVQETFGTINDNLGNVTKDITTLGSTQIALGLNLGELRDKLETHEDSSKLTYQTKKDAASDKANLEQQIQTEKDYSAQTYETKDNVATIHSQLAEETNSIRDDLEQLASTVNENATSAADTYETKEQVSLLVKELTTEDENINKRIDSLSGNADTANAAFEARITALESGLAQTDENVVTNYVTNERFAGKLAEVETKHSEHQNTVERMINGVQTAINTYVKDTDDQIEAFIGTMSQDVNNFKSNIDTTVTNFKTEISGQFTDYTVQMDANFDTLGEDVLDTLETKKTEIDGLIQQKTEEINKTIDDHNIAVSNDIKELRDMLNKFHAISISSVGFYTDSTFSTALPTKVRIGYQLPDLYIKIITNKNADTTAVLTIDNKVSKDVEIAETSGDIPSITLKTGKISHSVTALTERRTYPLSLKVYDTSKIKTASKNFNVDACYPVFYGSCSDRTVEAVSSNCTKANEKLYATKALGTVNVTLEAPGYFYLALPRSYGEPSFAVNGFSGGVGKVGSFVYNCNGDTTYDIYCTTTQQAKGTIKITIS